VDSRLHQLSPRVQPLLEALAARLPRVQRLDLLAGESCKTLAAIERTCDWLAGNGYDRGAALVGIGGGATSDHAGFVAAIYLRGIAYATCPTTLLPWWTLRWREDRGGYCRWQEPGRRLSSAAGGDGRSGVPRFVAGARIRRRMAEVVKAGLIADAAMLDTLEAQAGTAMPAAVLAKLIEAAVRVKVEVVVADERESGRRAISSTSATRLVTR